MKIIHLKHNEIDIQKWDDCILNACNSYVYAESWYLDIVSPNWEALILGNYEYVMPLPVKKKLGISFLVQPPLTQQLGVFSSNKTDENTIEQFIKNIPYKSYHLNFNAQNSFQKGIKQLNLILYLNTDYETIFSGYSTNTKRNIKKAKGCNLVIKTDLSSKNFLSFYFATEKNYPVAPDTKVKSLIEAVVSKGKATLYGAYNNENELISALVWLHSSQRFINLLPVSNREGKACFAMYELIDTMIQKYANQNMILDFEGSSIPNVARFYEGFGAEKQPYFLAKHWSVNDFIKWFRRKKENFFSIYRFDYLLSIPAETLLVFLPCLSRLASNSFPNIWLLVF